VIESAGAFSPRPLLAPGPVFSSRPIFSPGTILGMLVVVDLAAGHAIALSGPRSQVDHLTALGAKWPIRIPWGRISFPFASRTAHRIAPA